MTRRELFAELEQLGVATKPYWNKKDLEEKLAQAKESKIQPESETETPIVKSETQDYLRPWQIRKGTLPGSRESDPEPGSRAEQMKAVLLTQPKVRIIIPRAPKEDASIRQTVQLNDYRLDLPKQEYIEVPQQIAEVIMQSQTQTDAAIAKGQINYEAKKEGVSYADALL